MILHRNQRGFLVSPVYKHLKGTHTHTHIHTQRYIYIYIYIYVYIYYIQNKPVYWQRKKWLKMNGKMMTLTIFQLYAVYIKIRTILFPYLLISLIKERYISSVKSYKYWTMVYEQWSMNNGLNFLKNAMYMCTILLLKLSNFRKRKIHITHHCTSKVIYACILLHTFWKSPERVWVKFLTSIS